MADPSSSRSSSKEPAAVSGVSSDGSTYCSRPSRSSSRRPGDSGSRKAVPGAIAWRSTVVPSRRSSQGASPVQSADGLPKGAASSRAPSPPPGSSMGGPMGAPSIENRNRRTGASPAATHSSLSNPTKPRSAVKPPPGRSPASACSAPAGSSTAASWSSSRSSSRRPSRVKRTESRRACSFTSVTTLSRPETRPGTAPRAPLSGRACGPPGRRSPVEKCAPSGLRAGVFFIAPLAKAVSLPRHVQSPQRRRGSAHRVTRRSLPLRGRHHAPLHPRGRRAASDHERRIEGVPARPARRRR